MITSFRLETENGDAIYLDHFGGFEAFWDNDDSLYRLVLSSRDGRCTYLHNIRKVEVLPPDSVVATMEDGRDTDRLTYEYLTEYLKAEDLALMPVAPPIKLSRSPVSGS